MVLSSRAFNRSQQFFAFMQQHKVQIILPQTDKMLDDDLNKLKLRLFRDVAYVQIYSTLVYQKSS